MDENNKPETTNPSDEQVVEEKTQEQLVHERVLEVHTQPKVEEVSPVVPPQPTNDGGSSNVGTQSDSSKNDEAVLSLLAATTGRTFATIDDYKKHLANLNSLVGDQTLAKTREAAKQYETLVSAWATKNGKSVDEAKQLLADSIIGNVSQPATQPQQVTPSIPKEYDERLAKLEHDNQVLELEKKYPFAKEVADDIAIIAKQKGVSYVEAFENSPFKTILEQKAKEESKKSPVVTPSNRMGFDTKKVEDLGRNVLTTDSFKSKQDLVKEVLGL